MNHSIDDDLYSPADLNRWLLDHDWKCPHCGLNLREGSNADNLAPHVTGICRRPSK